MAEQAALARHNELRSQHQDTPPMELCNQLNQEAQAWANRGQFQHCQQRNGAGENLAINMESTAEAAAAAAVDAWYSEIKDWHFGRSNSFAMNTGHFTQLVWKESTKLGIGVARMNWQGHNAWLVVGRYKKHGNMAGAFTANVAPKGKNVFFEKKEKKKTDPEPNASVTSDECPKCANMKNELRQMKSIIDKLLV